MVDGDEGFHAANVRRIRSGEKLDLSDGAGAVAHCVVEEVGKGTADGPGDGPSDSRGAHADGSPSCRRCPSPTVPSWPSSWPPRRGPTRSSRWQASRCVARWDGQARVDKGLRRWRAVARSAARQSRRAYIPDGQRGGVDEGAGGAGARHRIDAGARAARIGDATDHRRAGGSRPIRCCLSSVRRAASTTTRSPHCPGRVRRWCGSGPRCCARRRPPRSRWAHWAC